MAASTGNPEHAKQIPAAPKARGRRLPDKPGLQVVAAAAVLHAVLIGWVAIGWRHPTRLTAPAAVEVRLVPPPALMAKLPPTPAPPASAPLPVTPPPAPVGEPALSQDAPAASALPVDIEVPAAAPADHWAALGRAKAQPGSIGATEPVPPTLGPLPAKAEPKADAAAIPSPPPPEPKPEVTALLRPTPKPPVPHHAETQPVHHAETQPVRSIPPTISRPRQSVVPQEPAGEALKDGDALYSVAVETTGQIGAITLVRSSGSSAFDAAGETMIRTSMNFPRPTEAGDTPTFFSVKLHFTPEQQ